MAFIALLIMTSVPGTANSYTAVVLTVQSNLHVSLPSASFACLFLCGLAPAAVDTILSSRKTLRNMVAREDQINPSSNPSFTTY